MFELITTFKARIANRKAPWRVPFYLKEVFERVDIARVIVDHFIAAIVYVIEWRGLYDLPQLPHYRVPVEQPLLRILLREADRVF